MTKVDACVRCQASGTAKKRPQKPTRNAAPKPLASPNFTRPLPPSPHVAIVGGGLAGLACALELASHRIRSTVFDTGEHGVGGRAATRSTLDQSLHPGSATSSPLPPEQVLQFDHAAQYFTIDDTIIDSTVAQHVARWRAQCVVQPWKAPVGWLDALKHTAQQLPPSVTPLVCPGGMRALATHMAAEAIDTGLSTVQRPMWVARMTARSDTWRLDARGRSCGDYDAVVIAHNGKCANRLVASAGKVPGVLRQLRRLKLSAAWVVMVAFAVDPLLEGTQLHGMHVRGCPALAWAGYNNSKLDALQDSSMRCWTLISTGEYGRANKVPQEAVPVDVATRVTGDLLEAWRAALGVPALPPVVFSRAQLWGAALPVNSPGVECVWDAEGRVGAWVGFPPPPLINVWCAWQGFAGTGCWVAGYLRH